MNRFKNTKIYIIKNSVDSKVSSIVVVPLLLSSRPAKYTSHGLVRQLNPLVGWVGGKFLEMHSCSLCLAVPDQSPFIAANADAPVLRQLCDDMNEPSAIPISAGFNPGLVCGVSLSWLSTKRLIVSGGELQLADCRHADVIPTGYWNSWRITAKKTNWSSDEKTRGEPYDVSRIIWFHPWSCQRRDNASNEIYFI
eukprot:SAG22_NODE_40_length_25739_cov_38.630031_1_plen_194_part_10